MPDDVTSEAAEPVVPARAAAGEVAAVRPAPQVSLRHLASRDGRPKPLLVHSRDIIECQKRLLAMSFITFNDVCKNI